jgi:hypothetical protein
VNVVSAVNVVKRSHTFRYTRRRGEVRSNESIELEVDRPAAIEHALRLLREHQLAEVEASCGGWRRTLRPGCLWSRGRGIIVAKIGSVPRQKDSVVRFLGSCPGLRETAWCYYLTSRLPDPAGAEDDTVRLLIDSRIVPALARYFEKARIFTFDCFGCRPEIPDWLDAEFYDDEPEDRVLVVYGLLRPRGGGQAPQVNARSP